MRPIKYPGLTVKQEQILDFIRQFTRDNGFPPTLQEVAISFDMTRAGPRKHLARMASLGYLKHVQISTSGFMFWPSGSHCPFCPSSTEKP